MCGYWYIFCAIPKYKPMKKSAAAKLHTRNLGTSILLLANINTNTTVPFPNMANKKTTQTPHLNVHQSNKSWQGKNGPKRIRKTNRKFENALGRTNSSYFGSTHPEAASIWFLRILRPAISPPVVVPRNTLPCMMVNFPGTWNLYRTCPKDRWLAFRTFYSSFLPKLIHCLNTCDFKTDDNYQYLKTYKNLRLSSHKTSIKRFNTDTFN